MINVDNPSPYPRDLLKLILVLNEQIVMQLCVVRRRRVQSVRACIRGAIHTARPKPSLFMLGLDRLQLTPA